jgi:hypothetical protein
MVPTDRSKSPIDMTTVMVKATTASMEICCETFRRLRGVRKVSGRFTAKKITISAKPVSVP